MWILVDISYLAHRARHSLRGMVMEDIPTGILFGFFDQLLSICQTQWIQSNKVLLFGDSRRSYRMKVFPDYKRKRKENRTEEEKEQISIMYHQVDYLRRDILPAIGFPVYGQKGLESDDLIAWTAGELGRRKEKGVIITSDGDLYQSINEDVCWYDPQRGIRHNPTSFRRLKGVHPDDWGKVKAMGGCSSDGVPGISGVSEKSAIAFIRGELPTHYKRYKAIDRALTSGSLSYWKSLTVLPHQKTKPVNIRPPVYNPSAFFSFCEEYGILSYLEDPGRSKWNRFFSEQWDIRKPRRRRHGRKRRSI